MTPTLPGPLVHLFQWRGGARRDLEAAVLSRALVKRGGMRRRKRVIVNSCTDSLSGVHNTGGELHPSARVTANASTRPRQAAPPRAPAAFYSLPRQHTHLTRLFSREPLYDPGGTLPFLLYTESKYTLLITGLTSYSDSEDG